ncbi:MFS transporter [Amycolatopsis sp. NPDC049253]|uniref:MFS transporter n=1 Tax=Amycolatopsis sp. NPDC049253 TaxID=3155274 RepID=UPI00344114BD
MIEYYDFALYGYLAVVIAPIFFPGSDPTAALLSTLAVFALAYVIRPLGGIAFGHIGDRFGRRTALLVTVVGIGLANTAVGLLPTFAAAGVAAPLLLVLVRCAQGFFAGGEVGGAATIISEAAPAGRKGKWSAFTPMGTNAGFAVASAVAGLVAFAVGDQQMSTWGWRIPFLLGLPLTIVCFLARRSVPVEEPVAGAHKHAGVPILQVIRKYPRALLKGIGIGIAVQGGAYISLTYITIYLVNNLHYGKQPVYWLTTAVTVFAVALMPFTGRLTDRIGALPVAVIGIAGYAVLVFPALVLMGLGSFGLVVVGYLMLMVPIAFLQVASYTLSPLLFDASVRYTGMALATNISVVVAGGSAPYVATWLVRITGNLLSPAWFVFATCLIGIITILTLRRDPNLHRRIETVHP